MPDFKHIVSDKQKHTIMLQNKDITKIQEIKTLFKDNWTQLDFLYKQLELFNFTKASKIFKTIKENGIPVWDIIKLLLIMPFVIRKTLIHYITIN